MKQTLFRRGTLKERNIWCSLLTIQRQRSQLLNKSLLHCVASCCLWFNTWVYSFCLSSGYQYASYLWLWYTMLSAFKSLFFVLVYNKKCIDLHRLINLQIVKDPVNRFSTFCISNQIAFSFKQYSRCIYPELDLQKCFAVSNKNVSSCWFKYLRIQEEH